MKIYDISRGAFSAPVFPGDMAPAVEIVSTARDDGYSKSHIFMTSHSGTHVDAPSHFIDGGRSIDQMELFRFVGPCTVWESEGLISGEEIRALSASWEKRLLIKGDVIIGDEAAKAIAEAGILLIGVEGLTVGLPGAPKSAHVIFLSAEVIILESLDLSSVSPGRYNLCAAPLKLEGCDGAPCRAILWQE
jgi:arylformamidase